MATMVSRHADMEHLFDCEPEEHIILTGKRANSLVILMGLLGTFCFVINHVI